jgi:hypothetical protein
MKDQNQMEMGAMFVRFLQLREQAESSLIPSAKSDALMEAVITSHQIIERLALFGAALNANFTAIQKKLEALGDSQPELLAKIDEQIGSLVGLRNAFLGFYLDEAAFTAQFEKMVRDRMLQEAGVDPNDQEAAMAYLLKTGKAQATPVLDPASN